MKIIKRNELPKPTWMKEYTCPECKSVFALEKGDDALVKNIRHYSDQREQVDCDTGTVYCPVCNFGLLVYL